MKRAKPMQAGGGIRDEYRPLDALKPDPANYNEHGSESVRRLAEQIAEVGFTAPFLVDAKTGILAAGHRRRLALLFLRGEGRDEPAGVAPGWGVPCRVGEWSELQRLKVLVGDNPDPHRVAVDNEKLADLLGQLAREDDLAGSGYSQDAVDALVNELSRTALKAVDGGATGAEGDAPSRRTSAHDCIRVLVFIQDIACFERAIRLTGEKNRASAVETICRYYTEHAAG